MIDFIDQNRDEFGVESICDVLPIAPSTYHVHAARRRRPETAPARIKRDLALKPEVKRVFAQNFQVYGARKVWLQMNREGICVARCTVARLMKDLGLQGVVRGKPVKTTVSDKAAQCPLDRVNRHFKAPAPNMVWVSDFTYVSTWAGAVFVAFVIDVFARRPAGLVLFETLHRSVSFGQARTASQVSAGGFRAPCTRLLSWTRWIRPWRRGDHLQAAALSTTAIVNGWTPVSGRPDPHSDGPFW